MMELLIKSGAKLDAKTQSRCESRICWNCFSTKYKVVKGLIS